MIGIDIPMPEKCGLCPCFHSDNPMYCQAVKADKNKKIVAPYGAPRPEWCPLKEQEAVVRCKDCKNWIPGYITDQDDFIPPKCGKYQQMVGHFNDDFCSFAEKQEGR